MDELVNIQPDHSLSITVSAFNHGAVTGFAEFLKKDNTARALLVLAMQEAASKRSMSHEITGRPSLGNVLDMLEALDRLLEQGPPWEVPTDGVPLVGCPMNYLFRPIMNTPSGWQFFLRDDVNLHIANMLQTWACFLSSASSTHCLSEEKGWCSQATLTILAQQADTSRHQRHFTELFKCPEASNTSTLGFNSWDAFFTREFMPGVRPVLDIPDGELLTKHHHRRLKSSIVHPCEARPVCLQTGIRYSDSFWLKDQRYSLFDMLGGHWSTERFRGGTLYQAFLSALCYHRWHAPVSGTVRSVHRIPGTYFSQSPIRAHMNVFDGSDADCYNDDPAPPGHSQPYLASVATRLLILLEADCSDIGLVAFLAIGMAEVSSCDPFVVEGQHVHIGQQIGTFRYGGSTYCLLFERGKTLRYEMTPGTAAGNHAVRSLLASVDETDDFGT